MFKKLKKWWQDLSLIKCDYCGNKVKYAHYAFNLPVKEYKDPEICIDCVKQLDQTNITYVNNL